VREVDEHADIVHLLDQRMAVDRQARTARFLAACPGPVLVVVGDLARANTEIIEHVDAVGVSPELR